MLWSYAKKCEVFDFCLESSYCDANDVKLTLDKYKGNIPPLWDAFFNVMFPYRKKSENAQQKCGVIFQTVFYLIHNGRKKTLMHVSICETIDDAYRSKKVTQLMNRHGLCISYDLERIDIGLAKRTIEIKGDHRVPVPPSISSDTFVHGVMDNFDHEENIKSLFKTHPTT